MCIIFPKATPFTILSPTPIQGAMVGSSQTIQCIVSPDSGVDSSSLLISWTGPGGNTITSDSRVILTTTSNGSNTYTGSIQFIYLMEGDEGTYTCNVMSLSPEASGSESVEIDTLTSKFIACSILLIDCFIVPNPTVTVTAPNTQTVGQSLTLLCSVTAVRGITSRVDIIWRSYGTVLRRVNDTSLTMIDSSLFYTDSYTIPQLCMCSADQNEVYQCEVVINASPTIMVTGSVTLDVMGECIKIISVYLYSLLQNNIKMHHRNCMELHQYEILLIFQKLMLDKIFKPVSNIVLHIKVL